MRRWLAASLIVCAASASRCDVKPAGRVCTISPPTVDFRLVASGTEFHDSLGRVVFLRGVDAGGRSKFAPYVPFDFGSDFDGALAKYMDRAASWGIDVVRVPFTWAALEPVQGQDDATWLAHYDAIIDAAWARGIWSVIDFHQDVYSENLCGDGFPSWTLTNPPAPHHDCPQWQFEYFNDDAVKSAFDAFWAPSSPVMTAYVAAWDRMVARYKDKPGVLGFEPINEPGWGSADPNAFSASTLSAFYTQMVPHMRGLAPSSLVFVDPVGLDGVGQTTSLTRPAGDGVVFAPHFYPLTNNPDAILDDMTKWHDVGATWNAPTFVGEFGASHDFDSTLPLMRGVFDSLDAHGMSGSEWEYSVASEAWNSESDSIVAADGTEYPVAQAVIRPFARAVSGSAIAGGFDASTSTFTLSFTPAANVSIVSLPARAYANGFDVSLDGACYDTTTAPGQMLVQPDTGATKVTLVITPR
jgi:endoglycosylceramidase